MDQWDPMKEAYDNINFNCYKQGVGRDLLGSSRCNKRVTLYVQGIPPTLGRNGFVNMFAEYGTVTENTLKSTNEDSRGSYGFITYENTLDAETAISHLDKKKLGKFTLKVGPALSEEERNRRRRQKQDEEMIHSYIRRDTAARPNDITSSSLTSSHQPMEDRSRRHINESSSQYQNAGFQPDSGRWNQQQGGIGRGSLLQGMERENASHHSFHSMGRGAGGHYSSHESLDYHQKHLSHGYQNSPIQERYQEVDGRNFARTLITPPKGPKALGICVYCRKGGCVNMCSSCKMYYCSNVCQKIDWPRHMEICHTIGEYTGSDADLSSIPHSNVNQMHNSSGSHVDDDDDDVERSHSQFTKVQNAHMNDRGHVSDNTMFKAKGQEMRHFNDYHRRGPSASTEHVNPPLHAAKVQNNTIGMIKGNDYINKTESHRGKETKTLFSKEPGQSQIVSSSNNSKRNTENNHERGTYRHQDERATAQVSQKCGTPANNKNNSNSRNFETKEAFYRTDAAAVSSNQETRVKDVGAPMKTKGEENMGNRERNQDCPSKHEEKATSLSKQKLNTKIEEGGRNTCAKAAAAVEANEKLPSAVELTLAVKTSGQCYLTYFESPYQFWISLQDYLEVFTETTRVMGQEISENSSTTKVPCKVGGTYGVMCMGEWCRVTVTSITGKEITVFFIDYGNQATVKQEDLRLLTVEMLELPAQAVCCCISKLKPKGSDSWSKAASAAMQQWLGEPMSKFLQFEVVTKRGSVHAVNISHNKKTLRNVLLAGGFAETIDAEPGLPNLTSSAARPMAGSLTSRMDVMKSGDKITGEFTDFTSFNRFIVVDVASAHLMAELTSSLQAEYKNNTVVYKPVQGELVAAQFSDDGSWYRAEVTNIDGENYSLYFVDYGNSEVQKVENIRRVANQIFMEAPKQALVCSVFTAQTLSGYSSKIVNTELKKLLGAAVSSEGYVSLLVRDKTNETLLVDIIDKSGQSLSDELTRKLSELPIEKQSTDSNRLIDVGKSTTAANKLPYFLSKPVLENMVTLSELGMETFAVDSGKAINVIMSAIKSPMEFYVRLNSKSELFVAMMKELDRSVMSSPTLSVPSVGILTAVQCSQNRIWCRAVIEKIEDKKCVVRFLDYGNSREALLSALKVLPPSVCHLPAQAIRCRLDGRLQNLPSASVLKFKDMERSSVDVQVCGNDSGVFSVQVFQGGTDIGASLIDSCSQHTSTVEPISTVKQPKVVSDILTETLPATGEAVTAVVTYIDSCSRLFIACKDVTELMIQLYESADSLPHLSNPVVGCVCAAQYSQDKAWYRVRIVQIKSSKTCIVQFLDYGNSEETSVSNLRELGPDMSKLPGQAICCCLSGYEQELGSAAPHGPMANATELINKLRLELLEKSVTVRVVDRKSDVWIVKLENEHGECINTKYKPTSNEIAVTPKLSDLTFEYPPDAEFEAFFLHINNLSDFYCQMYNAEMLAELDSLSEHLRDDVSRLSEDILVHPVINGVYTSKYMDNWYRCIVEEVRNTRVLIKYIDYGNSEEILARQLRPLSPERLQMPVRLMRCKLYGVTPVQENWSNPDMPGYLTMLRQSRVHLAIETRDADVFHVSVFCLQDSEKVSVAADLVDLGLAKFLQVVSPQKDESKSLPADPPKPSQQSAHEQDDDDDDFDEDMELQRKIQELQLQLLLSKQKKKQK